jgi:hypothetical protein
MADAKYTPGPLSVMRANGPDSEGEVGILDDHRHVVAECWADIRHEGEQALEEAMGNAILFAAAPDMLKAMQASVALADRNMAKSHANGVMTKRTPEAQAVYDQCVAAIAKATRSAS